MKIKHTLLSAVVTASLLCAQTVWAGGPSFTGVAPLAGASGGVRATFNIDSTNRRAILFKVDGNPTCGTADPTKVSVVGSHTFDLTASPNCSGTCGVSHVYSFAYYNCNPFPNNTSCTPTSTTGNISAIPTCAAVSAPVDSNLMTGLLAVLLGLMGAGLLFRKQSA